MLKTPKGGERAIQDKTPKTAEQANGTKTSIPDKRAMLPETSTGN